MGYLFAVTYIHSILVCINKDLLHWHFKVFLSFCHPSVCHSSVIHLSPMSLCMLLICLSLICMSHILLSITDLSVTLLYHLPFCLSLFYITYPSVCHSSISLILLSVPLLCHSFFYLSLIYLPLILSTVLLIDWYCICHQSHHFQYI